MSQQAELEAWLAVSEAHRLAYERAMSVWGGLDRFSGISFPAREAASCYRQQQRRRRFRFRVAVAGTAVVCLVLAAITVVWMPGAAAIYTTAQGERRAIVLSDGSTVELNTATELRVRFSDRGRDLSIIRGEAFFAVVHDAARPFRVAAGNGEIRDLGTQFDVRVEAGRVEVAVMEGEVEVAAPGRSGVRVVAGRGLAYSPAGQTTAPGERRLEAVSAWRDGRAVFDQVSLDDVLREIGRYHPVEWEFSEPSLKRLKLTGSFDVDNLPLFLAALQAALPVTAARVDAGHIRLSRAGTNGR